MEEGTSKNPIQVAERLFDVIELLADNGPMGIMEISNALGLHKSTTHRLVASLQYMGYIRQDEDTLKYSLSFKFLDIGSKILDKTNMAAVIHPYIGRLSEITGEAVHLVLREDIDAVYIDKVESGVNQVRMVSRVGNRVPLYCTGVGKALLAEMDDSQIQDIWNRSDIKKLTPKTIVGFDAFMENIIEVRQKGYALDDEENEEGVRCIAVTIRDSSRIPVYAISISAPVSRMSDERIEELRIRLFALRDELARSMGLFKI